MALPAVFVTGGNAGIGAAICKQLVLDRGCKVFLGSRSMERGQNAIKEMGLGDKEGNISLVQCDVQSDESVKDAAAKVFFDHISISDIFILTAITVSNKR